MFNYKFLAVLDSDYFQNNSPYIAKKIQNYADIIWYRVKDKYINYENIKAVRKNVTNCPLILSCYFKTAVKYGYDGVHLNSQCLHNYSLFRQKNKLITGYSCHNPHEIDEIDADYYTISPIYDTPKEYKVTPIGFVNYNKNKKVYGLGGINLNNISIVCSHYYGASGIRVIEEIIEKYNG